MTDLDSTRDAQVLRDFARMCASLTSSIHADPLKRLMGYAGDFAANIADVLVEHGATMAQQADRIEAEVSQESPDGS